MHWQHGLGGVGLMALVALSGCGRTGAGSDITGEDSDGSGASGGSGGKSGSGSGATGSGATGSGSGATGSGSGATGSGAMGSGSGGAGSGGAGSGGVVGSGGVGGGTGASGGASSGGAGVGGGAVTVGSAVTGFPGVGAVTTTGGFGAVTSGGIGGSGGGTWVDYGDIPIPDDCLTQYASLGSDYCDMQLSCSGQFNYTWCWAEGGNWHCECESPTGWNSYTISGLPSEDMCPFAASVCLGATEVDFSDLMCVPTYEERSSQYCSSNVQCSGSATLPSGVNVSIGKQRYAYCNQATDGWMCECDAEGRMALTFHDIDDGAALCSNMAEWCAPDKLERIGSPSCIPTYQWADRSTCNAEMECSQPATLDGGDVSIREWMPINCVSAAEGAYNCQCPAAGSFSVTSASTWDACTKALDACAVQ